MESQLKGITWNHSRGYVPLVALSQWYEDLHTEVQIVWDKRSLKEFGDSPVEKLAEHYDLAVIDHPFVGFAAAHHTFLPLETLLDSKFLALQASGSVGRSFESYWFNGHLWALPIDAAAPVSCWRPDLLDKLNIPPPASWEELCHLSKRGLVVVPTTPVDSLMNFYMFCCGLGEEPFAAGDRVVRDDVGAAALGYLKTLVDLCPLSHLDLNPISVYRRMVFSEDAVHCPFVFSYSNYARLSQYSVSASSLAHSVPLQFGNLVKLAGDRQLRSTLGGTGLALSSRCRNVDLAIDFAMAVADPVSQRGIYFASGGQPGHRSAWEDPAVNAASNGFFRNTLATLDEAYLRPRFNGYIRFQDEAGLIVRRYLREGGNPLPALRDLEALRAATTHPQSDRIAHRSGVDWPKHR